MTAEPSVENLFAELRAGGSRELRGALIERHLPLARSLAWRYRHTPQPVEDLVQVASLALIKAVDAFDPERGSSFVAFAVPTIVGELKHTMRDSGWAVRVPRSLQERVATVQRADRSLSARLGGAPTVQQLAAAANLTVEEVLEAFAAGNAQDAMPLDALVTDPADERGELDELEGRLALDSAIAGLAERKQEILRLRFIDGLTQTTIGERLGMTQFQVSRVLRVSLEELRPRLERS